MTFSLGTKLRFPKFTPPILIFMRYFALGVIALLFVGCFSDSDDYVNPLDYVNPFIGTGGHGHTYPGATTPFGMVQLSPDSRLEGWDGCGGYHYSDSEIYGFSHTHLQGTGISDYADILFMPTNSSTHDADNWGDRYKSSFKKENETASAGYYSVLLDDHNMKCELTATTRVGIHRYTPQAVGDSITLFIDMEHRDKVLEYSFYSVGDTLLVGHRISQEWAQEQHVYFAAQFSEPFHYQDQTFELEYEITEEGDTNTIQKYVGVFPIIFGQADELICKVALSSVNIDGAIANLSAEAPHWDFDQYHADAEANWGEALNKIQVKSEDSERLTCFYTALYHSMTVPNAFQDVDGKYRGTDLEIHDDPGHDYYTIFSLWDTFRATHPLYTIIERERTNDFIDTFLDMYDEGGQLPIWELGGNYTGCMIGYHSVPVIVDAYFKGITDFDHQKALEAMVQIADSAHLGKIPFAEQGYLSAEVEHESVSKTLEYAYDDWCIAMFAKELGDNETYERFIKRAQHYKNIYNPETRFMQAKRNGTWMGPFDPAEVNFNFTEANSYQYTFFAPQDVTGLIDIMGGEEQFCNNLDSLFTASMQTSGRDQPDITGLIGQYAHGNEPSHHMAYLYNYAGQPWKTQQYVREILDEQYWNGPDGLSGNEDCGQMSSWYVLSAMGMYSVTPGSDIYTFGSPVFEEVKINLENGKNFVIKSPGCGDHMFIENIKLDKELHHKLFITSERLNAGGQLDFTMSRLEQKGFCIDPQCRPVSAIEEFKICPVPTIDVKRTFVKSFTLNISCPEPGVRLKYDIECGDVSLQGVTYNGPLQFDDTAVITAWAEKSGLEASPRVVAESVKIDGSRSIEITQGEYANQYSAGGQIAMIDFLRGGHEFKTGEWQGYQGQDLEAIVDLGESKDISYLALGCLQDIRPWIVYPSYVEFWVSDDKSNWKRLGRIESPVADNDYEQHNDDFSLEVKTRGRYVKVFAKSYGDLPEWHLGAGGSSWLFVDEIMIK